MKKNQGNLLRLLKELPDHIPFALTTGTPGVNQYLFIDNPGNDNGTRARTTSIVNTSIPASTNRSRSGISGLFLQPAMMRSNSPDRPKRLHIFTKPF